MRMDIQLSKPVARRMQWQKEYTCHISPELIESVQKEQQQA